MFFTFAFLFAVASTMATLMPFLKAVEEENEDHSFISHLHPETCLKILEYLPIKDLGNVALTSKSWHALAEDESLWRPYFEKIAKLPGLNLTLNDMDFLQKKFLLEGVINIKSVNKIVMKCRESYFIEEFIKLGYAAAKIRKVRGLFYGKYGFEQDPKEAAKLNNVLAHSGNLEALKRKIEGLLNGNFGYNKNQKKFIKHNDMAARKGILEARDITIKGLFYGKYGYKKDHVRLVSLNEEWVRGGDREAKARKIEGLIYGIYGYDKDPKLAIRINNIWIQNGDLEAKERKVEGLFFNKYGYKKNLRKANKLKDAWQGTEDKEARDLKIEGPCNSSLQELTSKIVGLSCGNDTYDKNPDFLPQYLDLLKAVR